MAERSIVGRLRAEISDFKSKMRDAAASTKLVGDEATKTGQRTKSSFDAMAKAIDGHQESLNTISRGLGVGGAAIASFGVAAVKSAADFDGAMSNVKATGSDAATNINGLRQQAIKLGADTKFSATEAAGGVENLLKAGVSAQDVMGGGLKGALDLAAAGGLSVADSAETAATAMTQFGKSGKDVPHIADLLAAGAGKAQGEVSDMAQALNQSGLVASQFGLSIEDTVGTLSAFASAGLIGSDAGTSFKTMLLQLANPSKKASDQMAALGINAYDTQGKFVGVDRLAGQLKGSLSGVSQATRDQALAMIFGNDAIRAANVLYEQGSDGIKGWTDKVNDSGYAAETAATKMDNLQGDLEQLKGGLETALIGAGEGQQGPLRDMVQGVGKVVDKWNDLSATTKTSVSTISLVLGGIGLGGAAVIKVIQGAAAMKTALNNIGIAPVQALKDLRSGADEAGVALTGMGRAGRIAQAGLPVALLAVTAAVTYFADQSAQAKQRAEDFAGSFTEIEGTVNRANAALDENSRKNVVNQLSQAGAFRAARELGLSMEDVTDAAIQGGPALEKVNARIREADKAAQSAQMSAGGYKVAQDKSADAARNLDAALGNTSKAVGQSIQDENDKREALKESTGAQQDQKAAADAARDALKEQGVEADNLSDSQAILEGKANALATAQGELAKQTEKVIDNFTILRDGALSTGRANDQWLTSLNDLSKDAADAAGAQSSLADANEKVSDAEKNLRRVRNNGKLTADDIKTAERQLRDARDDQKSATNRLSDAQHANSKALKGNSDEAINNREKIRNAISAMNDSTTATFKNASKNGDLEGALKKTNSKLKDQKTDLVNAAEKAGFNRSEVKKMVDQMVLTPEELKTTIKTPGIDEAKTKVDQQKKDLDALEGTYNVKIDYKVLNNGNAIKLVGANSGNGRIIDYTGSGNGFATGGYISGPGTGTSDSINARLSNGEYVIKERSVRAIGKSRLDYMNQMGDLPKFRDGGLVNHGGNGADGGNGAHGAAVVPIISIQSNIDAGAVDAITQAIGNTNEAIQATALSYLRNAFSSSGGIVGAGSFEKGLDFARSQLGKPYVWAAAGPNGYDCSGFMGAIQNVIEGKHPYGRRWSTMAFQGQENAQGFTKDAKSAFMIGVTNAGVGHTAGTINGVNVESRGGQGVVVGPSARGWNDSLFPMHYGLTSGMLGKDGISGALGGKEQVSGSNQEIFRKLMLIAGYPASAWSMVDYIIRNESSWNVHARNPSSGAYGLPQALPGSKMAAYGPDYLNSAATQGNFFFDYVNKYGGLEGAYRFWQGHHWYADGGFVSGAGGPRDDKIPSMLSNGEFVVNAGATSMWRPLLESINDGGASRFASGGPVGTSAFGSSSTFSVAAIVKLIRELDNPTHELHQFSYELRKAKDAAASASKALAAPLKTLRQAKGAYDDAVEDRNNLRLKNARSSATRKENVEDTNKALAKQKDLLAAAKLSLDKMAPAQSKAASAQKALNSAIASRDSKARTNAEQIAGYNDKINKAKKGTVAYQNLINSKELAQKANAREIATANDKITSARKTAEKAGVNTAKIDAANLRVKEAQQAVDKAQDKVDAARSKSTESSRKRTLAMAEANAAVTKASNEKKKAQEAYDKALDRSKAKSDAYKTAQDNLKQAEQQLADAVRGTSDAFRGLYSDPAAGPAEWLTSMQTGVKDLSAFTQQIKSLRKLGLNEGVIQQIVDTAQSSGVAAGLTLASQVQNGGQGTIKTLNLAAQKLQDVSDILGYVVQTGTVRKASGGLISGPGGPREDRVPVMASPGEFMQQAAAVDYYGVGFMKALNDRRIDRRLIPHLADGGLVRPRQPYVSAARSSVGVAADPVDYQAIAAGLSRMKVQVQNPWTGEYMDGHMRVIAGQEMTTTTHQVRRAR